MRVEGGTFTIKVDNKQALAGIEEVRQSLSTMRKQRWPWLCRWFGHHYIECRYALSNCIVPYALYCRRCGHTTRINPSMEGC